MTTKSNLAETALSRSLAWLADAPMFIDGPQIASLYDAVMKPEYQESSIKLSLGKVKAVEAGGKVGVEAEVGFAELVKTIFPFLDAKAKAAAEASVTGKLESSEASEIELRPIDTPQRQLVQLALHYLVNIPGRIRIVTDPTTQAWLDPDFITGIPRGLVFVEFPPLTKFVPMAAETDQGKVSPIYSDVMKGFSQPKRAGDPLVPAPVYPEPAYFLGKEPELAAAREAYWNFFDSQFGSTIAMEAIEKISQSGEGGMLRWIDYRVPLGIGLPCIHLHVQGRTTYDTGTFAYQFVKRGFKHGLRVVGTMKSEPALNVLAIFEK